MGLWSRDRKENIALTTQNIDDQYAPIFPLLPQQAYLAMQ